MQKGIVSERLRKTLTLTFAMLIQNRLPHSRWQLGGRRPPRSVSVSVGAGPPRNGEAEGVIFKGYEDVAIVDFSLVYVQFTNRQ